MMRTFKVPFLSSVAMIHRAYKVGAFALGAVVLFGCPVYGGTQGDIVCDSQGNCCDEISGNCTVWNCDYSEQCPGNASCSSGICVSGAYDGGGYYYPDAGTEAGSGDCSTQGCDPGYVCTLTNGLAQCLPQSTTDASTDATVDVTVPPTEAGTNDTGVQNDTGVHDAGASDASDAAVLPPFTGCTNDNACTAADGGAGARCLDGKCVAEANVCSDSTQCPVVGVTQEQCVQGVCTPSCAGGASCPTGYSCDSNTSVCTGNPTPCGAADGGAKCAAGLTCVDEHCVPDCTAKKAGSDGGTDAGSSTTYTCSGAGLVCVDNGCIPDQTPQFLCDTQGNAQGTQDVCNPGSICLHHSCYIACSMGDGGNSCKTADEFNLCKAVMTSTGTFDVCGSSTNLGNQCDPTQGINCVAAAVCINGYCR